MVASNNNLSQNNWNISPPSLWACHIVYMEGQWGPATTTITIFMTWFHHIGAYQGLREPIIYRLLLSNGPPGSSGILIYPCQREFCLCLWCICHCHTYNHLGSTPLMAVILYLSSLALPSLPLLSSPPPLPFPHLVSFVFCFILGFPMFGERSKYTKLAQQRLTMQQGHHFVFQVLSCLYLKQPTPTKPLMWLSGAIFLIA